MSYRYKRGDVVIVPVPFTNQEGNIEVKRRPALVLDFPKDQDVRIICITSKNKKGKFPGLWIPHSSEKGEDMGIKQDSFINLSAIITILIEDIAYKIGDCTFMSDVEKEMAWAGIS